MQADPEADLVVIGGAPPPVEIAHAPGGDFGGLESLSAGLLAFGAIALARIDGEKSVAEEAQYLPALHGEGLGDGIEELIERVDIALPAELLGELRRIAHVADDECGADRLAVAALDLAAHHAPARHRRRDRS